MVRGLSVLLVLVTAVAGGLVGLQAGPAVWSILEHVGVVATPACNDVGRGTVRAMCARPRGMEFAALASAALCAAAAGFVTWRVLRTDAARPSRHDQAG